VPYLLGRRDCSIAAVFDPAIDDGAVLGLIELQQLAGFVQRAPTFAELLGASPDCLIISSPHCFHYEQAAQALIGGVHVLLDKPPACTYGQTQELVALARGRGLTLAVANQRRFEDSYNHVRSLLSEGRCGEILAIHYLFASSLWRDYAATWRGDPARNCGGVLMDLGYLAVDTLVWVVGELGHELSAELSADVARSDDTAGLLIRLGSGIATVLITYPAPGRAVQEELLVYGSRGAVFARRFEVVRIGRPPTVTLLEQGGDLTRRRFRTSKSGPLPLAAFLEAVQTGKDCPAAAEHALQTMRITDTAYATQTRCRAETGLGTNPHDPSLASDD
jgi:predicted dehydrogenase